MKDQNLIIEASDISFRVENLKKESNMFFPSAYTVKKLIKLHNSLVSVMASLDSDDSDNSKVLFDEAAKDMKTLETIAKNIIPEYINSEFLYFLERSLHRDVKKDIKNLKTLTEYCIGNGWIDQSDIDIPL